MRVFVLCTGRCGSVTFAKACEHITNYTVSHETNRDQFFKARFTFPENHIAVDYRFAWMLGRLDRYHGHNAFYVHLWRDPGAVVESFYGKALNNKGAAISAYTRLLAINREVRLSLLCRDMVDNMLGDIALFLKDKDYFPIDIDEARKDFPVFWEMIGAEGDMEAALREFDVKYNQGRCA